MVSSRLSTKRLLLAHSCVWFWAELPGKGDWVAFDAEFVSVQEEKSVLTDTGNKMTIRETRHALARISVLDCRTDTVLLDDHVLPREPVVDCLTRFSGIVAGDLDPKLSPHHLISTRTAYLKLRCLLERYVPDLPVVALKKRLTRSTRIVQGLYFCGSWFESRFLDGQFECSVPSSGGHGGVVSQAAFSVYCIAVFGQLRIEARYATRRP